MLPLEALLFLREEVVVVVVVVIVISVTRHCLLVIVGSHRKRMCLNDNRRYTTKHEVRYNKWLLFRVQQDKKSFSM